MKKIERFIVYGVGLICLAIGIFADLKVSAALYNPSNIFGQVGEALAYFPSWWLVLFCLGILLRFHFISSKKTKVISIIIYVILILGVGFYASKHTYDIISRLTLLAVEPRKWLIIALLFLAYIASSVPFAFLLREHNRKEATIFAFFVIFCFAVVILLMQGLKMIWLRPRYRTLVALYGEEAGNYFVAVYKPQFFWNFNKLYGVSVLGEENVNAAMTSLGITKWSKEEFYAFPSGHTLNALITMSFCYASSFIKKLKGKELYIRIGGYVFAFIIGLSRIIRGAHHLSDVSTSFLLATLVYDLSSSLLFPKLRKPFDKFLDKFNTTKTLQN